jgi:hypothetical protein
VPEGGSKPNEGNCIMADEITNSEDIIYVCDIAERIEELRELLGLDDDEPQPEQDGEQDEEQAREREDARTELAALESLMDDMRGYGGDVQIGGDWFPASLIRDNYFPQHAEELASNTTNVNAAEWPFNCIDWDKAAEQLQQDYSSVEFGGVTYWYR